MKNYSFASTSPNGHSFVAAIIFIVVDETKHMKLFAVARLIILFYFVVALRVCLIHSA